MSEDKSTHVERIDEVELLWNSSNLDVRLTRQHMLDVMAVIDKVLEKRMPNVESLLRVAHACMSMAKNMTSADGTKMPGKIKKMAVMTGLQWCVKRDTRLSDDLKNALLLNINNVLDPLIDFYVELDVKKELNNAVNSVKSCCEIM